jgi:hypothetical protein
MQVDRRIARRFVNADQEPRTQWNPDFFIEKHALMHDANLFLALTKSIGTYQLKNILLRD